MHAKISAGEYMKQCYSPVGFFINAYKVWERDMA